MALLSSVCAIKGLVVKSTGSWYRVLASSGECYDCRLRGNYRLKGNKQTNPIAVGDYVRFVMEADGTGVISDVEERRNYIVRKATKLSKQTHVIAANIDSLYIVATLTTPRTSTGFLDRLLVTAEAYRIPAAILFNKCDLYDEALAREQRRLQRVYEQAGYPVYSISALRGDGLDGVRRQVAGRTVLFCGHSGVGKSALLNALEPTLQLRVGQVSEWSEKGRHTTTHAELHPFAGGYLIDTPGIKEFGMVDIVAQELSHFFPEMRAVLRSCHFANCTHRHEPRCAVKAAVAAGTISEERYKNYLGILETLGQ